MKWLTDVTWTEALGAALAVALVFVVSWAHAAPAAGPEVTVVAITDSDGNRGCSAVVVAPGVAFTARHCTKIGMKVQQDGNLLSVSHAAIATDTVDAAVLYVPNLRCPCARPSARVPAVGVEVTTVGFPEGGERQVKKATVILVGNPNDLPEFKVKRNLHTTDPHIVFAPAVLASGDSGGGTFVWRLGSWVLVGINSIGVFDPATYSPIAAMYGAEQAEIASGSVPVAQFIRLQR